MTYHAATMSTTTLPKRKASVPKRTGRAAARGKKRDISWLVDRELPPAHELPENPVIVLRRRS